MTRQTRSYLLIDAALGRPVPRTPIWIMRQAGRYMPEYRAVREKMSFLDLCHTPEKAAEVSLLPRDILGVDGLIVFSDILVPLEGMGMGLSFHERRGPVLADPIRSAADVGRLRPFDAARDTGYLPEAIRLLCREAGGELPVLGFAGAPYTLACYAVEGGSARHYRHTKAFMLGDPAGFARLLSVLADAVSDLLVAQVEAGASLVQLFDTWAGDLAPEHFRRFAVPFAARVVERVRRPGVPVVYFVNGVAGKLRDAASVGADVLGIDWRIGLDEARAALGHGVVLQGNLDPCALFAPREVLAAEARAVLEANGGGPLVFNLGHGILPEVRPEDARFLVDTVKEIGVRDG